MRVCVLHQFAALSAIVTMGIAPIIVLHNITLALSPGTVFPLPSAMLRLETELFCKSK